MTGSHGEYPAGEFEAYILTGVVDVPPFDAGVKKEDARIGRMRIMNDRGIPAGVAEIDSTHIGDVLSAREDGVLNHINDEAASLGVGPEDTPRDFTAAVQNPLGVKS